MAVAMVVDLASVPILLDSSDEDLLQLLRQRFGAFTTSDDPLWRIHLAVTCPSPAPSFSPRQVHNEAVTAKQTASGWHLDSETFVASIDRDACRVTVSGPRAVYPLELTLRHLLPLILVDGLLVHATLLVDGGQAWVCCGPSGSGKTTLASLLSEYACCDEMVAVRRDGACWRAISLPYWRARPASASLQSVLLLHHAGEHRRNPLGPAGALRALSSLILWPSLSPAAMERTFDLLTCLVHTVPLSELLFAPRRDVWPVLRGDVG